LNYVDGKSKPVKGQIKREKTKEKNISWKANPENSKKSKENNLVKTAGKRA